MKLLVLVMWDILVANVQVARLTLGPIQRLRPAFVEVPIELENDLAISVLVSIVSLTRGRCRRTSATTARPCWCTASTCRTRRR